MASQNRALTRAIRARAAATGEKYTRARNAVLQIGEIAASEDVTLAEAEAIHDDPRNEIFCKICGWTVGMVCPECPGCGCYNLSCSGWRHAEVMDSDELRQLNECPECGGDMTNHYDCTCYDDPLREPGGDD